MTGGGSSNEASSGMPSPPRLSCRLEVLPGASFLERIEAAGRYGFDAVSLPGRILPSWRAELIEARDRLPLPLASLSLGHEGSLVAERGEDRDRCRRSLRGILDLCARLSVPVFNLPPLLVEDTPEPPRRDETVDARRRRRDRWLLEALPPLADAARERGVTLALEPVNRYETDYLRCLDHAVRLCDAVSHEAVGVTADLFHMQIEELDPCRSLERARRWLRHVHVAENTRVEPGPGSLDLVPALRTLASLGYRGVVEVECRELSGPADEVLPRSVRHLHDAWRRATAAAGTGSVTRGER